MIKYFCDECGIEVSDPSTSLDMTGKILCNKHYDEYQERNKNTKWVYSKKFTLKNTFRNEKKIFR